MSFEEAQSKGLGNNSFLQWSAIIHAIPQKWKTSISSSQSTQKPNPSRNGQTIFLNNKEIDTFMQHTKEPHVLRELTEKSSNVSS